MDTPLIFTGGARALLKRLEGCRLAAYRDQAGVLTVGYGHTGDVLLGQVVTQHQADIILDCDLQRFVAGVERLVEHAPTHLSDEQFSALVIFCFNVGLIAFAGSTALRDVMSGHLADVPHALALWNKIRDRSGVPIVNAGLVARRNAEIALWTSHASPPTVA